MSLCNFRSHCWLCRNILQEIRHIVMHLVWSYFVGGVKHSQKTFMCIQFNHICCHSCWAHKDFLQLICIIGCLVEYTTISKWVFIISSNVNLYKHLCGLALMKSVCLHGCILALQHHLRLPVYVLLICPWSAHVLVLWIKTGPFVLISFNEQWSCIKYKFSIFSFKEQNLA